VNCLKLVILPHRLLLYLYVSLSCYISRIFVVVGGYFWTLKCRNSPGHQFSDSITFSIREKQATVWCCAHKAYLHVHYGRRSVWMLGPATVAIDAVVCTPLTILRHLETNSSSENTSQRDWLSTAAPRRLNLCRVDRQTPTQSINQSKLISECRCEQLSLSKLPRRRRRRVITQSIDFFIITVISTMNDGVIYHLLTAQPAGEKGVVHRHVNDCSYHKSHLTWPHQTQLISFSPPGMLAGPAGSMSNCRWFFSISFFFSGWFMIQVLSETTGPIFTKVSGLRELWKSLINRAFFFFRSRKAHCHGNRL